MKLSALEIPHDDPSFATMLETVRLPTSDLAESGQFFYAFNDASELPVGFGGFFVAGENALLRSVVVNDERRGKGLGATIVEALLDKARSQGARQAWLLTKDADGFFARLGFNAVARSEAPAEIGRTPQFSGICPGSAAFMHRDLTQG